MGLVCRVLWSSFLFFLTIGTHAHPLRNFHRKPTQRVAEVGNGSRIVGGYAVPPETLGRLAQYSVQYRTPEGRTYWNNGCSASVISRDRILTAAHCFTLRRKRVNDKIIDAYAWVGVASRKNPPLSERRRVRWVDYYESYDPAHSHRGDLAIVTLEQEDILPASAPLMSLPYSLQEFAGNTRAFAAGYGRQNASRDADIDEAREVRLKKRAFESCAQFYPGRAKLDEDAHLCATMPQWRKKAGKGVCAGDSGGPLFVIEEDGTYRQIGITSFGHGRCGQLHSMAWYVRVAGFVGEIRSHMHGQWDAWKTVFNRDDL